MQKEWNLLKTDKLTVANLAKELGVDESIAHLLVLRNIRSFEDAKIFFRPKLSHLHDPFLMKDMVQAIVSI